MRSIMASLAYIMAKRIPFNPQQLLYAGEFFLPFSFVGFILWPLPFVQVFNRVCPKKIL